MKWLVLIFSTLLSTSSFAKEVEQVLVVYEKQQLEPCAELSQLERRALAQDDARSWLKKKAARLGANYLLVPETMAEEDFVHYGKSNYRGVAFRCGEDFRYQPTINRVGGNRLLGIAFSGDDEIGKVLTLAGADFSVSLHVTAYPNRLSVYYRLEHRVTRDAGFSSHSRSYQDLRPLIVALEESLIHLYAREEREQLVRLPSAQGRQDDFGTVSPLVERSVIRVAWDSTPFELNVPETVSLLQFLYETENSIRQMTPGIEAYNATVVSAPAPGPLGKLHRPQESANREVNLSPTQQERRSE